MTFHLRRPPGPFSGLLDQRAARPDATAVRPQERPRDFPSAITGLLAQDDYHRRAMAGDPGYPGIGPPPSRGKRILDNLRYRLPRMVGDAFKGGTAGTVAGVTRIVQALIPGEQPRMAEFEQYLLDQIPEEGIGAVTGLISKWAPEFTLAGDLADLGRIPGHVRRGEWGGAGLSALATIPILGTPVAGLLKARKGVRAVTEAAGIAQEAERVARPEPLRAWHGGSAKGAEEPRWFSTDKDEARKFATGLDDGSLGEWELDLGEEAIHINAEDIPGFEEAFGYEVDEAAYRLLDESGASALVIDGWEGSGKTILVNQEKVNMARVGEGDVYPQLTAQVAQEAERVAHLNRSELQALLKERGLPATGTNDFLRDAIRRVDQSATGGLLEVTEAATPLRPGETLPPEVQQRLRSEYPEPAPGVPGFDKKKQKPFVSRGMDESNQEFWDARKAAQADIDAGNYEPFFPESERYYANPANYASDAGRTTDEALPKRRDTLERKIAEWDTPEIRERFRDAYELGSRDPNSLRWYAVGQLEDAAIDELGVEAGSEWFRRSFAEAMASTTGGQAPRENLMMAAYSNFRHARGLPVPEGPLVPRPVQGQYMSKNLTAGERALQEGLSPANQPKGFNFSRNFMGELDRGTMDKQMTMGGTASDLGTPPPNAFPIFENTLREEAAKLGLPTAEMQDVSWAGFKAARDQGMSVVEALKEGVPGAGAPMIRHINEAIERTSRLTGQTPTEVVRRWLKLNAPLYGVGGLLGLSATQREREKR